MRWKLILTLGIASISAACVSTPTSLPPKPPTPTLEIVPQSDGGICLDRANAIELGNYIITLEAGYEQ